MNKEIVVLDFETSGMSPDFGDRAIEIGAVKIVAGQVVDEFQSLINPGFAINGFIIDFTGINNQMLESAPPADKVFSEFKSFLGGGNLVAHNASFDKRFLDAEFEQLGLSYTGSFSCSMLIARRLLQNAPNHKLGTLVDYLSIKPTGQFHRALADAQMTAQLWFCLMDEVKKYSAGVALSFEEIQKLAKVPKKNVIKFLEKYK